MTVYEAKTYFDFVHHIVQEGVKGKRRGSIKALALKLKCHSTFVSKVLRQKAHLNHEQAARFCIYADLSVEDTEFFFDLLNRDRTGSAEARKVFQNLIEKKLIGQRSLQTRAKVVPDLTSGQEVLFFKNWYLPIIHTAFQIPNLNSPDTIARALKVEKTLVVDSLRQLESIGLAKNENGRWKPLKELVNIDADSPINDSFQSAWRMKTGSLLQEQRKTNEHTHATAIVCISTETAESIREILLRCMEKMRKEIKVSPPERLYTFCLDFYPFL